VLLAAGPGDDVLTQPTLSRIGGQERHAHAVLGGEIRRSHAAEKGVGTLHEQAGTIARVRIAA
jgi:hypothetical protein